MIGVIGAIRVIRVIGVIGGIGTIETIGGIGAVGVIRLPVGTQDLCIRCVKGYGIRCFIFLLLAVSDWECLSNRGYQNYRRYQRVIGGFGEVEEIGVLSRRVEVPVKNMMR